MKKVDIFPAMETIRGLRNIQPPLRGVTLTIGNFDGVHLGHRALIAKCINASRHNSSASAVLTFDPHPLEILQPQGNFLRIFPINDLKEQLALLGVTHLVVEPFSEELAQMEPEVFWENRVQAFLEPREVVVGYDFGFGSGRAGNLDFLRSLSSRYGFDLSVMPPFRHKGDIVSSTLIRGLIGLGKVREVREFLGRCFEISGTVVKGRQLGRQLGFPTANLGSPRTLLPPYGVYLTKFSLSDGQAWPSITNVGEAPTVGGKESGPRIETHILENLSEELYNQEVRVSFYEFSRPERKFSDIEALKTQMRIDVEGAKLFWEGQRNKLGLK
ncbi:MAG: bifunctional riboflavin kinase/FAD synthetase [Bdellovibrionales bacterium]|nr:bifunctional riboflavin kinase/FAD synthetase [Bdellovibrionales bacterium]